MRSKPSKKIEHLEPRDDRIKTVKLAAGALEVQVTEQLVRCQE